MPRVLGYENRSSSFARVTHIVECDRDTAFQNVEGFVIVGIAYGVRARAARKPYRGYSSARAARYGLRHFQSPKRVGAACRNLAGALWDSIGSQATFLAGATFTALARRSCRDPAYCVDRRPSPEVWLGCPSRPKWAVRSMSGIPRWRPNSGHRYRSGSCQRDIERRSPSRRYNPSAGKNQAFNTAISTSPMSL